MVPGWFEVTVVGDVMVEDNGHVSVPVHAPLVTPVRRRSRSNLAIRRHCVGAGGREREGRLAVR